MITEARKGTPIEDATKSLEWQEYKLAVETQMHFNDIIMRFRSFGVTVVFAVYSYAVTRKSDDAAFRMDLSPTQVVALAGVVLTVALALLDIFYFYPLLLGAVDRSTAIEAIIPVRITSSISKRATASTARCLVALFYLAVVVAGGGIFWLVKPGQGP